MKPEIDAYLREHGARYTADALRSRLIAAGHDAAEVDAALRETEGPRRAQLAEARSITSRFWRWAIALHLVALVVVGLMVLNHGRGTYFQMYVNGVVVLGVAMLMGFAISVVAGRALLGRGIAVALVAPLISVFLIGGTCLAISGTLTI